MEANPKLPSAINGRRQTVNESGFPALTSPTQRSQIKVADAIRLPKWRAALASVNAGAGNARLLCLGDSTTFGVGSNGSTSTGDMKPLAWPTQMMKMLNSAGTNAHANSFMGSGTGAGGSNANDTNDARVVMGSGWSHASATFITIGGAMYTCSSATSALSFTPTVPVDTFNIFYYRLASAGTFGYDINGAGSGTQSTAGASGFLTKTITGTLGLNTLNLNYSSGNALYIAGVEAYDSSKKSVSVINGGLPAVTTLLYNTNNGIYSPAYGAIAALAPNLTVISLGLNDLNTGKLLGTSIVNTQAIITAAQAVGDVALATFNPGQITGSFTAQNQAAYTAAMANLAANNNIPFIDNYSRQQSYVVNSANGLIVDSLHLNGAGYFDYAAGIYNSIGSP